MIRKQLHVSALVVVMFFAGSVLANTTIQWKNGTARKVSVENEHSKSGDCPPSSSGGFSNFTLEPGGTHSLTLAEDQAYCWSWRYDDDPSTEIVDQCRSSDSDSETISETNDKSKKCKQRIRN